jgi:hypothetical protein
MTEFYGIEFGVSRRAAVRQRVWNERRLHLNHVSSLRQRVVKIFPGLIFHGARKRGLTSNAPPPTFAAPLQAMLHQLTKQERIALSVVAGLLIFGVLGTWILG